jgi:tripartite-type tricarboxylate transporter receptor subunit TctC
MRPTRAPSAMDMPDESADRVQALYSAVRKTVQDPKVAASLKDAGYDVDLADPAEYAEFTKREVARYRQLIESSPKAASAAR